MPCELNKLDYTEILESSVLPKLKTYSKQINLYVVAQT